MIKIHEKQFEVNDPMNFQERTIEYSSFEKYISDLENEKSVMECVYPSIPRCTRIERVTKGINFIVFIFRHRLLNIDIKHIAEVIK